MNMQNVLSGKSKGYVARCAAEVLIKQIPLNTIDLWIWDTPFPFRSKYFQNVPSDPDKWYRWFRPLYMRSLECITPSGYVVIMTTNKAWKYAEHWFGVHGKDIYYSDKCFSIKRIGIVQNKTKTHNIEHSFQFHWDNDSVYPPPLPGMKPWRFKDCIGNGRAHPTPLPPDLIRQIISKYSQPGQIVCDLTCGIGTALVEAKRTARRFIGGEICANYVKLTHDWLRRTPWNAQSQEEQLPPNSGL